MAVAAAIELIQNEEFKPAGPVCRVVATSSTLERCKLYDAEELNDLLIHGRVGGRTGLWCGLYVELSCMLLKGVRGKLGFKWLFGICGGPGCFVVCVAPVFEEEVNVDNVCVYGLDDLAVYVLSVSVGVGEEGEGVVVDLVELNTTFSKIVSALVLDTVLVSGDAQVHMFESSVSFNPSGLDGVLSFRVHVLFNYLKKVTIGDEAPWFL